MTNLPSGMFSSCNFGHETWVRSVAANPMTDIEQVLRIVKKVLSQGESWSNPSLRSLN